MASVVERGRDGSIIYKAGETLPIPSLDVLSVLFDSNYPGATDEKVLHVDAEDPSKSVTRAQLRDLIKRTAYAFRTEFGLGSRGPEKDVVLTLTTGHFLLPNVFFATIAADAIFSASSPASTPAELAGQIEQVSAKLLLCTSPLKDTAVTAAKIAGLDLKRVLVLGDGHDFELRDATPSARVIPIPPPKSSCSLSWRRIEDPETLENSIICLVFSSGTTGKPKGVKLSHTNMVAAAVLAMEPMRVWYRRNKPEILNCLRTLGHLPAAHIAGIQGYFLNPTYLGGTVYWMPRFDFLKFLEYNKKHQINIIFSVPPIYVAISKFPGVTDQFDNLDHAVTGAAPMGRDVQMAVSQKLGKGTTKLSQTWGLSETTGSFTLLPKGMTDDEGSVSPLLANSTARIVDDDGKDVPPGEDGEILVKGPVVTKGYYQNEKADRESFRDGWFCTGDIGHFKNGMLYIVDRKKELIKYKGIQVAPAELEGLLLTHPKIMDAAVVGVRGEDTEVPRAYIVADPKQISAQDIIDWVASRVANHKRLRGGVFFLQAIPKSPSGKILRRDLRALAASKL